MEKKYDTTVLGLYVLDILGRPVSKIPDGGNLAYIDELRTNDPEGIKRSNFKGWHSKDFELNNENIIIFVIAKHWGQYRAKLLWYWLLYGLEKRD